MIKFIHLESKIEKLNPKVIRHFCHHRFRKYVHRMILNALTNMCSQDSSTVSTYVRSESQSTQADSSVTTAVEFAVMTFRVLVCSGRIKILTTHHLSHETSRYLGLLCSRAVPLLRDAGYGADKLIHEAGHEIVHLASHRLIKPLKRAWHF